MLKEEKKKPLFTIYDYLKKTYQYAKYSKKNLLFFLLGNVAYCIINVIAPLLSARQILYLTDEIWKQLIYITLLIFALEILRNVVMNVNNYFINKYFYAVKKNIQLEMCSKMDKMSKWGCSPTGHFFLYSISIK